MGRPRAGSNAVETPARILSAAREAFARQGYAGATLAEIAKRADIRRPSLLYHFGSKEFLYAAVIEGAFAELGQGLARAFETEGDYGQTVSTLLETWQGFAQGRGALARLVLRELLDDRGEGKAIVLRTVLPLLDRVEQELRRRGGSQLKREFPLRAALVSVCLCLLYTSPSPRDQRGSRMPSSA